MKWTRVATATAARAMSAVMRIGTTLCMFLLYASAVAMTVTAFARLLGTPRAVE
jgi:hypothetical protein